MSVALLFSGQGTQHARMLGWLATGPLVDATNAALQVDDWRSVFDTPGRAARNDVAQPLLTGVMLAAWQQLAPLLPPPAAVAGYSVGELAAYAAAGVFDADTALALARVRADAMDRCAIGGAGGLLAVSGIAIDRIDACLAALPERDRIAVAIRNAPAMLVLGGDDEALAQAADRLASEGARCVRLDVGVPSHTRWMRAASTQFAAELATRSLHAPRLPLFSCSGGRIAGAEAAAAALAAQISTTLRWDDCLDAVQSRRVDCVLEIGPGSALAAMWNQRFPDVPARSVDEFAHVDAIAAWVARQGERGRSG